MTEFSQTPTEKAAAAWVERERREAEDLMRDITETIEQLCTGFADFLHECKVQGFSLDETIESFDRSMREFLPLKRKAKE
jgi:hypothetical protein